MKMLQLHSAKDQNIIIINGEHIVLVEYDENMGNETGSFITLSSGCARVTESPSEVLEMCSPSNKE
jgi:hypothetical protein